MRTSPSSYPEQVDFYCPFCERDYEDIDVESIEADDVVAECPGCGDTIYVRCSSEW